MAQVKLSNVKLQGIAAAVPKQAEKNLDYDKISEEDRKKLIATTGIEERRIASKGVTGSDLCLEAANVLLAESGWKKNQIELLVNVGLLRDYVCPPNATILQDRIGLPKSCAAFDVTMGCSGYVYSGPKGI